MGGEKRDSLGPMGAEAERTERTGRQIPYHFEEPVISGPESGRDLK